MAREFPKRGFEQDCHALFLQTSSSLQVAKPWCGATKSPSPSCPSVLQGGEFILTSFAKILMCASSYSRQHPQPPKMTPRAQVGHNNRTNPISTNTKSSWNSNKTTWAEKTQLMYTPEKPACLGQESLRGHQWPLPAKFSTEGQVINKPKVINGCSCYLQSSIEFDAHIPSQIWWRIGCSSKNPSLDNFGGCFLSTLLILCKGSPSCNMKW